MATRETKQIGGREYTFSRCSATQGLDLQWTLAQVGASEIAGLEVDLLMGALGGSEASMVAFGIQATQQLGNIVRKLSKDELLRLMKMLFEYVDCDGVTISNKIDQVFQDRPADLWEVFIIALQVNLGPLGERLRGLFKGMKVKGQRQSDQTT